MSGVYLIVWDDNDEFDRVLKPTRGGWPHITLAYTGKHLAEHELKIVAARAFDAWCMKKVTLDKAVVNSFHHEKTCKTRYDVLLNLSEAGVYDINASRSEFLCKPFPDRQEGFFMREPHVTAKICWTEDEAKAECDRINALLPITVTITGVTID